MSDVKFALELELIFHKSDGLSFQSFFNELMRMAVPGFCPVRQQRDGGNDGFVGATGTFYQVYSPQRITDATLKAASLKLVNDFDKLAANWHYLIKLKKYVFVLNDKYQSADAEIIRRVAKLGQDRNVDAELLTSGGLEDLFYKLEDGQQRRLINKYSIGRTHSSAIKIAAQAVSENLPIEKWTEMDEQISYGALDVINLKAITTLVSKLFSMNFPDDESVVVKNLVARLNELVNVFHDEGTFEQNGERCWDGTWKRIYPHPMAGVFNQQLEAWQKKVSDSCYNACAALNEFATYIRKRHLPAFLDYCSYSMSRREAGSIDVYNQFIPGSGE